MDDKIKEILDYLQNCKDSMFNEPFALNQEAYTKYRDAVNVINNTIKMIKKNFIKKAFISQPMNGLSEEEILEVRNNAKSKLESLGYEVVNSYFEIAPDVKNTGVYMLGGSLKLLSDCELIYMCDGWPNARGCVIERSVAEQYGIDIMYEGDFR